MDTNTVIVIAIFALVLIGLFAVFRQRTKFEIRAPLGTGLKVDASNDPAMQVPGAVLERAKSTTGGATIEDDSGHGARASDIDVAKDIKVINKAPRDSSDPKV